MSVQTIPYAGGFNAQTNRNRSEAIWHDCPWDRIRNGELDGVAFFDDFDVGGFVVPTTAGVYAPYYQGFSSTGGTIQPATQVRAGVITLGSDGDNEGAAIQTANAPFLIQRAEGKLWFEARVSVDATAVTLYDAFVGLMEASTLTATVPITATAGLMADKNLVGFMRPGTATTGDGSSLRFTYKANGVTAVVVETVAAAFVAATFIKLGFVWDPTTNLLTDYINGVKRTTTYTMPAVADGTDFPNDTQLALTAGVTNAAGITSVFTIDWWRCAQLGSGIPVG